MQIIEADAMGLCFGVRDALQTMRNIQRPTEVTVLGQLVHNPVVGRELASRGFQFRSQSGSANLIQTPRVMITAHGISDRERAQLAAAGLQILDTTCPLVKKAHTAALQLAQTGHFLLVIGKKDHIEVRGLTGDLPPGNFQIVETPADVHPYPAKKIGIIAQTTAVQRDADKIVAQVRLLNPASEVRFINTICQPTRDRQAALDRLLQQIHVLIVVGGHTSNNTRQLTTRAREAGIRTFQIEEPAELTENMFSPKEIIGLTAGTSTLPETIQAVKARLQEFFPEPFSTPIVRSSGVSNMQPHTTPVGEVLQ